jgi:putative hemolysin
MSLPSFLRPAVAAACAGAVLAAAAGATLVGTASAAEPVAQPVAAEPAVAIVTPTAVHPVARGAVEALEQRDAEAEAAEQRRLEQQRKQRAQAQAREAAALKQARDAQRAALDPRSVAASIAAERYGWGADQFRCLDILWNRESSWDHTATNPSSGAYGIPQSLPADKMASHGADWRTNAATQISWGLDYISQVYGSPCAAWAHSQSLGWY